MNYLNAELTRSAKIILDRANVKKAENLLIISETASDNKVVDTVFAMAYEREAVPTLAIIPTRGVQMIEPPKILAFAMKAADVIISLIPIESLDCYTKAWRDVLKRGTRVLGFQSATVDKVVKYLLHCDFRSIDKHCEVITHLFSNASDIKVSSPGGTKISAKLGKRPVANDPGKIEKPGDENYLPPACVNVAPLEDSWNGVAVFDALVSPPIGLVKNPVVVEVKKGKISKIIGKEEARIFQNWLESFNDENMFRLCHVGVGVNPDFKEFTGHKNIDERILGAVIIGFGTNDLPCFGGTIRAKAHTDGLMKNASIYLDGVPILQDGKFVHPDFKEF